MGSYLETLKKYATFAGRARRREYWMFALFNIIIAIVLDVLAIATNSNIFTILYLLFALGTLLPALGVLVRRLHDIGKSGGWFWIGLIPFVGGIWLLVLLCTAGNAGPNQYGPDPKAA
jgi:uncharacterized membrane protein YhaH (DUF805 family)